MNTTKKEVKVGLIGVGLNTYWNQFEGLLSRLTDYQRMIKERMSGLQATVIDGGIVDSPEKATRTAEVLKSEDIETSSSLFRPMPFHRLFFRSPSASRFRLSCSTYNP